MFSIIYSVAYYKTLSKCKSVTVDGVFILAPIIADSMLIINLVGIIFKG